MPTNGHGKLSHPEGPIIACAMTAHESPPEAAVRRVAWSMGAGAAYDAVFGIAILLFADTAAGWMDLPLPENRAYLGLNGVFLLLLAGLYSLPAVDPVRYRGVVVVAAAGRTAGFFYLGTVWLSGHVAAFAWLACADLAFAVVHVALLAAAARRPQVADRSGA
jgi:hypothetical protein